MIFEVVEEVIEAEVAVEAHQEVEELLEADVEVVQVVLQRHLLYPIQDWQEYLLQKANWKPW
jgi:hypothetical protein